MTDDQHYSYSQLMSLWEQAGGSKLNAAMAAAIAMAESGGNPNEAPVDANGTIDRGLWQINSSWGSMSSFDPLTNARSAVTISKNGTTWRPWCTAYSDGACGTKGGTYLGAGAPFLKYLNGGSTGSATLTGTNTSPNTGNSQYASMPSSQDTSWYNWLIPFAGGLAGGGAGSGELWTIPLGGISNTIENGLASAIGDVLKPIGRALLHTLFVVGGVVIMGFSIYLIGKDSAIGGIFEPPAKSSSDDESMEEAVEGASEGQAKAQPVPMAERRQQVSEGRLRLAERQQTFRETQAKKKTSAKKAPAARKGRTEKASSVKGAAEDAAEVAAV